jgi:uncharacterized membrane protein
MVNTLKNIFNFYKEGFLSMNVGKKLWIIIGIKLFIMFAILKVFFFQDFLSSKFNNDKDKSEYIIEQITNLN